MSTVMKTPFMYMILSLKLAGTLVSGCAESEAEADGQWKMEGYGYFFGYR
ncbi:hypothetical protein ACFPYJ_13940 [Paenibacillus solisilvae]|uniref:Lipoprotein n=1 Tax=Paenibacillus solisilvae TaxID=2486751 RepID=A0ABW0VYD5_9BACL